MSNLNIVTRTIRACQKSPAGSTAIFNSAYEAAIVSKRLEDRTEVPFKETQLYLLQLQLASTYREASAKVVADGLYLAKGDVPKLFEVLHQLEEWHSFVEAAHRKTVTRLGWKNVDNIALFNLRQDETWTHVDDLSRLATILADKADRQQVLVFNSGLMAKDLMEQFTSHAEDNPLAWERVVEEVKKTSDRRYQSGRASSTDQIIGGTKVLTPFMIPHVLNRFLAVIVKLDSRLVFELEKAEESRARAIKEIAGDAAESYQRKVGGYTDLSGSDSRGYCSPAEEARVDQEHLVGDEDKGVPGINDLKEVAEGIKLIEESILDVIYQVGKAMEIAEEEPVPAVYLYLPDMTKIVDRDEAVSRNAASLQAWIVESRGKSKIRREDAARYDALNTYVPTFTL